MKEINKADDKNCIQEENAKESTIDKELNEFINRNKLLKNGLSKIIKEIKKNKD